METALRRASADVVQSLWFAGRAREAVYGDDEVRRNINLGALCETYKNLEIVETRET